jgi:tRNA pseudouridine38-40 synthase
MRLVVAYDGTDFHGFARNDPVPTVGGALEDALGRVLGAPVRLTCAGRTDRGVHAWGQVVSFDTAADPDPVRLRASVNALVGPKIVVREATVAGPDFDARRSATWRRYRYHLLQGDIPHPFFDRFLWWIPEPLDVERMEQAAAALRGPHDFSAFCRRPPVRPGSGHPPSLVREVLDAGWSRPSANVVRFTITATAFCHQMVRSIVGLLIDVGIGKLGPESVPEVIAARDRSRVGRLAPPRGLCLWEVGYGALLAGSSDR